MPIGAITDEQLVARAMKNAKPHSNGESPRWAAVMDTFALGSTYAYQLCEQHGLDPEEKVSGPHCDACYP